MRMVLDDTEQRAVVVVHTKEHLAEFLNNYAKDKPGAGFPDVQVNALDILRFMTEVEEDSPVGSFTPPERDTVTIEAGDVKITVSVNKKDEEK